jgi:hypothetical protein
MSKQKKVFLILSVVFFALLLYASYDIGSRTTFPGTKSHSVNQEEIDEEDEEIDKVPVVDTLDRDPARGLDSAKIRLER